MAVLMTYHKLVERDAKNVDIWWKVISISLLVLAIISSMIVSSSFQRLIDVYDDHCVLNADLVFQNKTASQRLVSQNQTSSTVVMRSAFVLLPDVFNETYAKFLEKDAKEYPIEQVELLHDSVINLQYSEFSKKGLCEFGVYMPVFQCIFGIIMLVMFVICGKGGKSDPQAFLSQPWRIVTPALVFFLIMTIVSIVNLVIIENGLSKTCESFSKHVPAINCGVALNRFMLVQADQTIIPAETLRILVTTFNYIAFFCWLSSLLWLLARIVFVVDFQLVRVTVKTIEFEQANESTRFQVVEVDQSGNDEGAKLATTEC